MISLKMYFWILIFRITPSIFRITPSLFPKRAPLSPQAPLQWSLHPLRFPRFRGTETSGSGDVTAPSRCSEPLRSKDGGPSKVSPNCAGWDRRDAIGDIASDASVSSAFRTWHFFWRMKNKK